MNFKEMGQRLCSVCEKKMNKGIPLNIWNNIVKIVYFSTSFAIVCECHHEYLMQSS